ncbi:MAG: ligase-associated DNA damage response endonuclease PdeM [Chitinophagaceae bacterium]
MKTNIKNEELTLVAEKAIFWEKEKIMIISDLHIGKVTHFRKAGIPIPTQLIDDNLQRLNELLKYFNPEKVIITGDLFHSNSNSEHEIFAEWLLNWDRIEWILVKGNHDIINEQWLLNKGFTIHKHALFKQPFVFVHDTQTMQELAIPQMEEIPYVLAGHVHPGYIVKGPGKQTMRFPCFYFGKEAGLLPSFGSFTGMAAVKKKKGDQIFVILPNNPKQIMAIEQKREPL